MAIYFENNFEGPKTHILIVGIGAYPFLQGGSEQLEQQYDWSNRLGQLTSPPVSAEVFFDTVIDLENRHCWIKPIGSIEVLVSETPGGSVFKNFTKEAATMDNIEAAYWRWKARCDQDVENVAIFYFCGHGLEKSDHYCLAEDFGNLPQNPWGKAFSIDKTRDGFCSCIAQTQIFLIDSCRTVTKEMLATELIIPGIENSKFETPDCLYDLTQKAAAKNEMAHGKKNKPSYYMAAMVKALNGHAAKNVDDQWIISTSTLATKMNNLIGNEAESERYAQRCISRNSLDVGIIRLTDAPMVPFAITCYPDPALWVAELHCTEVETQDTQSRPANSNPWSLEVKAGIYKVEARFQDGKFKDSSKHKSVEPPSSSSSINCN